MERSSRPERRSSRLRKPTAPERRASGPPRWKPPREPRRSPNRSRSACRRCRWHLNAPRSIEGVRDISLPALLLFFCHVESNQAHTQASLGCFCYRLTAGRLQPSGPGRYRTGYLPRARRALSQRELQAQLVITAGFEPATYRMSSGCSSGLSYAIEKHRMSV
jgi:hypothetical protein